MIIQCDKCSTKFRIDDSKVTGAGVKVRCTKCQNVFIAAPPPPKEEAPSEETAFTPPPTPDAPQQEEKTDVDFNFDQPQGSAPSAGFGADAGDTGFSSDASGEGAAAGSGGLQTGSGDFDLSSGTEPESERDYSAGSKDLSVGGDFNFDETPAQSSAPQQDFQSEEPPAESPGAGEWSIPAELKTESAAAPAPTRESVVSYASAPEPRQTEAPAQKPTATNPDLMGNQETGVDASAFDKTADELENLARNLPGEEAASGFNIGEEGEEGVAVAGKKEAAAKGGGLVTGLVIIISLVIILAAAYFKGLFSSPSAPVAQKTVDIAGISGSFVDNKNAGRLLVVQAKITNLTDSAQTVRGVKGIIYGPKNETLSTVMVSAGRTLTPDDLKNMTKDDIAKAFKDRSSASIPPKASAPVMIVFTTIPQNMSEFGMEIVQ